jgi:NAD(P)-dependent dehydrogenase (short-subunit alcohol dehydrogenase family)
LNHPNVSNPNASIGSPQVGTSAYAAAKGIQFALTREWAAESLQFGTGVNTVILAEVLRPSQRYGWTCSEIRRIPAKDHSRRDWRNAAFLLSFDSIGPCDGAAFGR